VLIFIYGADHAFARKQQAADNPWGAGATRWNGAAVAAAVPSVRSAAAGAVTLIRGARLQARRALNQSE